MSSYNKTTFTLTTEFGKRLGIESNRLHFHMLKKYIFIIRTQCNFKRIFELSVLRYTGSRNRRPQGCGRRAPKDGFIACFGYLYSVKRESSRIR